MFTLTDPKVAREPVPHLRQWILAKERANIAIAKAREKERRTPTEAGTGENHHHAQANRLMKAWVRQTRV